MRRDRLGGVLHEYESAACTKTNLCTVQAIKEVFERNDLRAVGAATPESRFTPPAAVIPPSPFATAETRLLDPGARASRGPLLDGNGSNSGLQIWPAPTCAISDKCSSLIVVTTELECSHPRGAK